MLYPDVSFQPFLIVVDIFFISEVIKKNSIKSSTHNSCCGIKPSVYLHMLYLTQLQCLPFLKGIFYYMISNPVS